MTIAGLTPDDWDITVRDEHVESSEVDGDVDLVGHPDLHFLGRPGLRTGPRWQRRGAKVVLGGLHPTSLPYEAAEHADAVCIGPAETVWGQILDDFEHGRLQKFYRGRCEGSAALVPLPRRDLMNPRAYLLRHTMVTSRGCPHACDFCYKSSFWGPTYYEPRPIAEIERELSRVDDHLVFFLDDNLLANRRHARALFDVLRGSGIVWQAAASLDVARDPHYLEEAYAGRLPKPFCRLRVALAGEHARQQQAGECRDRLCRGVPPFPRRRHHDQRQLRVRLRLRRPRRFRAHAGIHRRKQDPHGLVSRAHAAARHAGVRTLGGEGRLLHRNWSLYDTYHAVFRPRRMTPEQLEAGYSQARRQFAAWSSILRRSLGPARRSEADCLQRGVDEGRPALGRDHPRRPDALCDPHFRAGSPAQNQVPEQSIYHRALARQCGVARTVNPIDRP